MAPSDLDQLVDMGFEKEKASIAVKRTGGLAEAIDWLDKNADTSVEELKKEDADKAEASAAEAAAEAKSYVCNECGKRMRGMREVEFHSTKSDHTDFSESTEEIAPLTEEEKAQKLAELRERANARKAAQSEQDKVEAKRNEQISRKKNKETEDLKEQMRVKEQIKDAEKQRREKQDAIDAKKRIQAKIAADKEERRLKNEREKAERAGQALPQPTASGPVSSGPTTSKPASAYTETRLRFQTPNGNILKTYPVETTLFEIASALADELGQEVESFTQTFPKKVFDKEFFGETLKDLKMVPSASLIVK